MIPFYNMIPFSKRIWKSLGGLLFYLSGSLQVLYSAKSRDISAKIIGSEIIPVNVPVFSAKLTEIFRKPAG